MNQKLRECLVVYGLDSSRQHFHNLQKEAPSCANSIMIRKKIVKYIWGKTIYYRKTWGRSLKWFKSKTKEKLSGEEFCPKVLNSLQGKFSQPTAVIVFFSMMLVSGCQSEFSSFNYQHCFLSREKWPKFILLMPM